MENEQTPEQKTVFPSWIKWAAIAFIVLLAANLFFSIVDWRKKEPEVSIVQDTRALDSLKTELNDALMLDSIHRGEYLFNQAYSEFIIDSLKGKLKSQMAGIQKLKVQFKIDSIAETKKSRSQKADEYIKWLHKKDSL